MKIIVIGILILLSLAQIVNAETKQLTLRVDGLACPFCAYGLEKKITKIGGVTSYDVDLKEGKIFVEITTDAQIIFNKFYKAVKEAGFTLMNISLRAKGKIGKSKDGLVLLVEGSEEKLLLFESEAIAQKYQQGKAPKALSEKLERELLEIKKQGKEVLIEGIVHEHEGLLDGLAVENLEVQ